MNQPIQRTGYPLGTKGRVFLVAWSLFLLAGFFLATRLEPDPRGFGTHQRLGLPPCTIRVLFEIPCPNCGMTTSFSNFVRGNFVQAARANAAGLLLATICVLQIPWCCISAVQGRLRYILHPLPALLVLLSILVTVGLLNWLILLTR